MALHKTVSPFIKDDFDIAIIGMSVKTVGAESLSEFWQNLIKGREALAPFVTHQSGNRYNVKLLNQLTNPFSFDAPFFNVPPQEAMLLDPQHRHFLQLCYHAIEHSGYALSKLKGTVSLFGSKYTDTYLLDRVYPYIKDKGHYDILQAQIGNEKDHLCTYVAYKLGLSGPAVSIQSACSSSLVAVHHACESLNSFQSDVAIAGGVTISLWQNGEYQTTTDDLQANDGHCRAYDDSATGTVYSNGMGVVILKRLDDALRDGDTIYSVIKGSAINNDGAERLGYAAPNANGQIKVINSALSNAGIQPHQLNFIEGHGTGTKLGDELELEALHRVFSQQQVPHFCALSSVKSSIGHTGVSSGVIGLIKASLSMYHRKLPPQINYDVPQRRLQDPKSPFYINKKLTELSRNNRLTAGISSFGLGGTNSHVVIQNWQTALALPDELANEQPPQPMIFPFSAKSPDSLQANLQSLVVFLKKNKGISTKQIAWNLQQQRSGYNYRSAVIASDFDTLSSALKSATKQKHHIIAPPQKVSSVFLFPAQDHQLADSVKALCDTSPVFKQIFITIKQQIHEHNPVHNDKLNYFLNQLSIAKFLNHFQLWPDIIMGIGIGEITALHLSNVLNLRQSIQLIQWFDIATTTDHPQAKEPLFFAYQQLIDQKTPTQIALLPPTTNVIIGISDGLLIKSKTVDYQKLLSRKAQDWYAEELLNLVIKPDKLLTEIGVAGDFTSLYNKYQQQLTGVRFASILPDKALNSITDILAIAWQNGLAIQWPPVPIQFQQKLPLPNYNFELFEYEIPQNPDLYDNIPTRTFQFIEKNIDSFLRHQWHILLGAKEPNDDQTVYEYNATSLILLQLMNLLNNRFSLSLTLADMYTCLTFKEQVDLVKQKCEDLQ